MKRIIALALVICAVAMTARAQSVSGWSGNTLYERWRDGAAAQQRTWCLGYMSGYRDGIALAHPGPGSSNARSGSSDARLLCIPAGVTAEQMKDVVVRALKDDPATRHTQASYLVALALSSAWICRK